MKETPILFSTQMVQAIQDGRKTQTRRLVKDVGKHWICEGMYNDIAAMFNNKKGNGVFDNELRYPKGIKGDIFTSDGLYLPVIDVRVERLHDISEADAIAEGVDSINSFMALWIIIKGKKSWDANPYVWVYEWAKLEGYMKTDATEYIENN